MELQDETIHEQYMRLATQEKLEGTVEKAQTVNEREAEKKGYLPKPRVYLSKHRPYKKMRPTI